MTALEDILYQALMGANLSAFTSMPVAVTTIRRSSCTLRMCFAILMRAVSCYPPQQSTSQIYRAVIPLKSQAANRASQCGDFLDMGGSCPAAGSLGYEIELLIIIVTHRHERQILVRSRIGVARNREHPRQ